MRELLREDYSDRWRGDLGEYSEIKFLKWVRNGFFHGNRFNFDYQPGDAEWRGWEITEDLKGYLVFTELYDISIPPVDEVSVEDSRRFRPELKEGFMEDGDAFALVDDIIEIAEEELS